MAAFSGIPGIPTVDCGRRRASSRRWYCPSRAAEGPRRCIPRPVPSGLPVPRPAVRLYVCAQGIVAYRSSDTFTWTREQTVVTRGPNGSMLVCDPSLVSGTGTFVYKTGT